MNTLIIVESPSKAKTIQKYLGEGYTVLASGGHVRDLPEHTLGIDLSKRFRPEYEITDSKKSTISKLKTALSKSGDVFLATDPDREGEAISWHLKTCLGIPDGKNRIVFNEISKKAVNSAISAPREIDMNLVNSQQARRVLDRLVGYLISPVLSKKVKPGCSAGRVQSAALEMIVKREREIRDFKPEEYWNIYAFLSGDENASGSDVTFRAHFSDINGEKWKIHNQADAEKVLNASREAGFRVDTAKRAVSRVRPQAPFTTSTMQQDAGNKLSLSAPETMRIAQQLYEGVDIPGEGPVALVTYIRTDSVRVASAMQFAALDYIAGRFGKEYAPVKPNFYKNKSTAQDAHEAIRPISLERTPESLRERIDRNQYKLYKLIYDRFLASQMAAAVYNTLNVRVTASGAPSLKGSVLGYRFSGRTPVFDGFTRVYAPPETEEDAKNGHVLPDLREGSALRLRDTNSEQKFTKPPQRFTDSALVKSMEENGIGRPSTYASVISVIGKRGYVEREGRAMKPTPLGEIVTDYMTRYFPNIMDMKFTANMESRLDRIEEGGVEWQEIVEDFYPGLTAEVDRARRSPQMHPAPEPTDYVCEKCGAKMVIRDGRYGKFLSCSRYPDCNFTKPLNGEDSGLKCPKCGKPVVQKKSKKGKTFYSCTGYPSCDFISWDPPAPYFCPECGSVMKRSETSKGIKYSCTNAECTHAELIVPDGGKQIIKKPRRAPKAPAAPKELTDSVCEKCGAKMVIRKGKFGNFLACSRYPVCRFTKPLPGAEKAGTAASADDTGLVCPICGKPVVIRKTKTGKTFYGCSGYPSCKFMSWEPPAPHLCPNCGSVMTRTETAEGVKFVCTKKECGHAEILRSSGNED